jgi:nucleotide-binding universal stress UspA family protein
MKKILVPTDFSDNALKALNYAIQVANKMDATIYVLHAYQVSSGAGRLVSIDHIIQEDREQELNVMLRKIKPLLGENTRLESFVKRGSSVDTICQAADKFDVDLIIMGTTGASGMKKVFMGSTASNVIKNIKIPVLAVPADFSGSGISNITVALDNKPVEDAYILKPIADFVKKFDAKLNLLLVVDEDHEDNNIDPHLQEHFKQFGVIFTYFKLTAENAADGILDFVAGKQSDMLCLIHHNRAWFEEIFHSSVAQKMAFESKVPLLVLRG